MDELAGGLLDGEFGGMDVGLDGGVNGLVRWPVLGADVLDCAFDEGLEVGVSDVPVEAVEHFGEELPGEEGDCGANEGDVGTIEAVEEVVHVEGCLLAAWEEVLVGV